MKNFIKVALRYATKTHGTCTLHDEEHLQIIEELLSLEDAQFTDDEHDNSVELEKFNFELNS